MSDDDLRHPFFQSLYEHRNDGKVTVFNDTLCELDVAGTDVCMFTIDLPEGTPLPPADKLSSHYQINEHYFHVLDHDVMADFKAWIMQTLENMMSNPENALKPWASGHVVRVRNTPFSRRFVSYTKESAEPLVDPHYTIGSEILAVDVEQVKSLGRLSKTLKTLTESSTVVESVPATPMDLSYPL